MIRLLSVILVVLPYLSTATVLGVFHHHTHADAAGHDEHCAACHWQLEAKTAVPAPLVAVSPLRVAFLQVSVPPGLQAETPFLPSRTSRAPPTDAA